MNLFPGVFGIMCVRRADHPKPEDEKPLPNLAPGEHTIEYRGAGQDKTFKFKPTDKTFEVGEDVDITVPKDAQFATAQVTYRDGTSSSVQKFVRTK